MKKRFLVFLMTAAMFLAMAVSVLADTAKIVGE